MIFAFFGDDTVNVRKKASAFVAEKEKLGAEIARIGADAYMHGQLADAMGSASLFGNEQVIILDTPSGDAEMFEDVFEILDTLSESTTTFVLIEGKLLAPQKRKLQKYAKDLQEFEGRAPERFNTFALGDALASRDKKKLWMLLMTAKADGIAAEELVGILFWQLKALRLAEKTGSAAEAGMKPFVFDKAKRALGKFKSGELDAFSERLVLLYHEGHAGRKNIDVALERWVLAL